MERQGLKEGAMEGEAKWTQEPWATDGSRILARLLGHKPTPQHPERVVAQCSTFCTAGINEAFANSSRIVACVNACAGIPDPAAELKRLREANAEMAMALERVSKWAAERNLPENCESGRMIIEVRAALAKHQEAQK